MNKKKYITELVRANRRFEKIYLPAVRRALREKAAPVIELIEAGHFDAAYELLSRDVVAGGVAEVVKSIYEKVGVYHARRMERAARMAVRGKADAQQWLELILEYLRHHFIEKITIRVNNTLRAMMQDVVSRAIAERLGITWAVNQIDRLTRVQAARIVRTEVTRATGAGTLAQGVTFPFEMQKEWVSIQDFRTRGFNPKDHASHMDMDGQRVGINEPFVDPRNGDRLMFPGDPDALAESTINCRCSMVNIPKVNNPRPMGTVVIMAHERRVRREILI